MKQILLSYSAVYSNRMTTRCVEELTHMFKHRSVWFVVQWPSTAVGQE